MARGKKKNYRRRRNRKRRNYKNSMTVSTQHPLIASDRSRVKMVFEERNSVTVSSGALNYRTYRGNSLFDPNYSGAGTQPTGFDQWAAMYYKYVVRASHIEVTIVNLDGTESENETLEIALLATPDYEYLANDPQHVGTLPYGKFQVATFTGNPQGNKLTNYMSTAKIWGVSKNTVGSEKDFSSLVTTNPTNDWYWTIYIQPANESNTDTYVMYTKITYYAEFFDRKVLDESLITKTMRYLTDEYEKEQLERRQKAHVLECKPL